MTRELKKKRFNFRTELDADIGPHTAGGLSELRLFGPLVSCIFLPPGLRQVKSSQVVGLATYVSVGWHVSMMIISQMMSSRGGSSRSYAVKSSQVVGLRDVMMMSHAEPVIGLVFHVFGSIRHWTDVSHNA